MRKFESKKLSTKEARQVQGAVTRTCGTVKSGTVTATWQSGYSFSHLPFPDWCAWAEGQCQSQVSVYGELLHTQRQNNIWIGNPFRAICHYSNSSPGGGDDWDCIGSLIWC